MRKAGKRQFVLLRYCIMQPRTSFLFDPILNHLASVLIAAAVQCVECVARVCFAQLYFKDHCETRTLPVTVSIPSET